MSGKDSPSTRPGTFLALGGAAGFVALIIYATATHQHRTDTESVILVILLFLFLTAMVVGGLRRAHFSAKYPYKIVWPVQLLVWAGAVIAPIVLDFIEYRYFGRHWGSTFWGRELLYGPIYGICGALAWKFGLKPKIMGGGDRPLEGQVIGLLVDPVNGNSAYTVTLNQYPGPRKIALIKAISELKGLSLRDAKNLVEAVPSVVEEGISKTDVELVSKKLEETGVPVKVIFRPA
jgi:hypothetical protein